jgi:hypothetical protein
MRQPPLQVADIDYRIKEDTMTEPTELTLTEAGGVRAVEGPADAPFLSGADDAARVIEACLSYGAGAALLYAANLPAGFFDLSSGQAGAMLQKLRNYRVRLAIVCPPGSVRFSSRFEEMMVEERRAGHFGVFETREGAWEWLGRVG